MNIQNLRTEDLVPYLRNAKKHDKKQIENVAESIKQFGMIQPIVVDEDNNVIIGHCRLLACRKLGMVEVPCVKMNDLSPEQVNKLRLLDNKLNESEWDFDLLKEDVPDLDWAGFDIDWGFELETEQEEEVQEIDVPEAPEEPVTRKGDIWILGENRLMCGDSTDANDVFLLMNGEKADLLLTDPPYNVNYEGGTDDKLKIQNDNMESEAFYDFLLKAFQNGFESLKEGAGFYIWYASREVVNFSNALEDAGLHVRQELIWNKSSLVIGRQDYQWKHEPCLYGWKEGAGHNWYNDRKQTTVIDFERPARSDLHPTMKPIGLFDYQMRNSTKAGDLVLDLFGGSGTSIMASQQNGRRCFTMEYDEKYCDVIVKRWENLTGQTAYKADSEMGVDVSGSSEIQ